MLTFFFIQLEGPDTPNQITPSTYASHGPIHGEQKKDDPKKNYIWQGLLALKTEQAAVQMYYISGNKNVASQSLPMNSDRTTPPLRIFQRMRFEAGQMEGVCRKIQVSTC